MTRHSACFDIGLRMRASFALAALLAGAVTMSAAPLEAATPRASVKTLTKVADQRLGQLQAARVRVSQMRLRQAALASRITVLKGGESKGAARGELASLLRASLAADAEMKTALSRQGDARADVEQAVRRGVSHIDREIRSWVPKLKAGPVADRRAAARHINDLRAARRHLRDILTDLDDPSAAPKRAWARYQVKIAPLDGPAELDEKADFVEDTRDKLKRKRFALAKLLKEAKQEREIARAARDFDTYVRIFEEENRNVRVTQRSASNDKLNETASPPPGGSEEVLAGSPGGPAMGNNQGTESPPNGFQDSVQDPTSRYNGRDDSPTPTTQSPTQPQVILRDVNADVLINLRVDELATQELDLATLQRLIAELEELDGYLGSQAKDIRKRARTLEADENRRLDN